MKTISNETQNWPCFNCWNFFFFFKENWIITQCVGNGLRWLIYRHWTITGISCSNWPQFLFRQFRISICNSELMDIDKCHRCRNDAVKSVEIDSNWFKLESNEIPDRVKWISHLQSNHEWPTWNQQFHKPLPFTKLVKTPRTESFGIPKECVCGSLNSHHLFFSSGSKSLLKSIVMLIAHDDHFTRPW